MQRVTVGEIAQHMRAVMRREGIDQTEAEAFVEASITALRAGAVFIHCTGDNFTLYTADPQGSA